MIISEWGSPGERQTGKTTRALKECQAAAPAAIYVAPFMEATMVIDKLLGETARFAVVLPYRFHMDVRGMVPDLVVVDCYDLMEPNLLEEIKAECALIQTTNLRLIHSGKVIQTKEPRAGRPSKRTKHREGRGSD